MGTECESSCESGASRCRESEACCECGSASCSGEPMDCATQMWTGSFWQALKAAQVELLKAKIQKAWGPTMEKAAEAVIETMGAKWQALVAQAQAQAELQERLSRIMQEGKKS